jgi:hypothetical protein
MITECDKYGLNLIAPKHILRKPEYFYFSFLLRFEKNLPYNQLDEKIVRKLFKVAKKNPEIESIFLRDFYELLDDLRFHNQIITYPIEHKSPKNIIKSFISLNFKTHNLNSEKLFTLIWFFYSQGLDFGMSHLAQQNELFQKLLKSSLTFKGEFGPAALLFFQRILETTLYPGQSVQFLDESFLSPEDMTTFIQKLSIPNSEQKGLFYSFWFNKVQETQIDLLERFFIAFIQHPLATEEQARHLYLSLSQSGVMKNRYRHQSFYASRFKKSLGLLSTINAASEAEEALEIIDDSRGGLEAVTDANSSLDCPDPDAQTFVARLKRYLGRKRR